VTALLMEMDSNAARQATAWATSGRRRLSAQVAPSRPPDARSTTIANTPPRRLHFGRFPLLVVLAVRVRGLWLIADRQAYNSV